ncbi:MAG: T9SS type A sorting domain-containing protein [Candidatus Marinimicrobia bacterium]|nr:T9SS type A sorting domain-containing protein [Candidatus Neomarinimicrobiota bacterium]
MRDQYGGPVSNAGITIFPAGKSTELAVGESDSNGYFSADISDPALESSQLLIPYPNPSQGQVMIPYYLRENGNAGLDIFNLRGQRIRTFRTVSHRAGFHQLKWNGRDNRRYSRTGGYLYRTSADGRQCKYRKNNHTVASVRRYHTRGYPCFL